MDCQSPNPAGWQNGTLWNAVSSQIADETTKPGTKMGEVFEKKQNTRTRLVEFLAVATVE